MPFAQTLADPRLAELNPAKASVVRERLWGSYLKEMPGAADKYAALEPEAQAAARGRFNEGMAKVRPEVFSVTLEPGREVQVPRPSGSGAPGVVTYTTEKVDPVRRPLYDPKTEAFIDAVQGNRFDTAKLDDETFEELIPLMRGAMREERFNNFVSPYRERLMNQDIGPAWGSAKAAVRGMVPTAIENLAAKTGDPEDEDKYRKWSLAYGDIKAGFGSAGTVLSLVGGGVSAARTIEKIATRSGVKVAADLVAAGALDYAFADKLPGFSAELFDDPLLKELATGVEGMAFAAAPMAAIRAVGGPGAPKAIKATHVPQATQEALQRQSETVRGLPEPRVVKAPKIPKQPSAARQLGGDLFSLISTRLENINPELKFALRRFESDLHTRAHAYRTQVDPWLRDKRKRMTKKDATAMDAAERNGDKETVQRLVQKYRLTEQYKAKTAALDAMYKEARDAGFDVGYLENFAPRRVKDVDGLMREIYGDKGRWGEIDRAMRAEERKLGVDVLDMDTQAHVADSVLRGYGADRVTGAKPGAFKERKLATVPEKYLKYYAPTDDALLGYIDTVVNSTAKKKFFGQHIKSEGSLPFHGQAADDIIREGVGSMVSGLVREGKILPWQQADVGEIFRARMVQKPGNSAAKAFKNLSYIQTMGSPISAITQLGDFAWSAYKNGYFRTFGAALRKKPVKVADLGIEKVAQEFSDTSKTAKAVDKVFKMTGLTTIDRLGKETLINASLKKWQGIARKPGKAYNQLSREMAQQFGPEAPKAMDDLANGRVTENVKFALFNRLLDFQPVALSEVPLAYLKHPNGRVLYMLKTFTLKQLDVWRREVFREMARGNHAKALNNSVKLGAAFVVFNATADQIKDLMLNRKTSLDDRVIDNVLRAVGVDKWAIYETRRTQDPGKTATQLIMPPTSIARQVGRDVGDILKGQFDIRDAETIQSIPIIGKPYYFMFGGGAERLADKDAQLIDTR